MSYFELLYSATLHTLHFGAGHNGDMTTSCPVKLDQADRGSRPLPCPEKVRSAHRSHSWNPFQGCSLERATWCEDHLRSKCETTNTLKASV